MEGNKNKCFYCDKEILNNELFESYAGGSICGDCAFIYGYISEEDYLTNYVHCIVLKNVRATVHDGKVFVGVGRFPWERSNQDIRNSSEYVQWRRKVFERDSYTCAICEKVGGKLNAHHIKPFKTFENERFNVNNGITLCADCHRKVHKDKNSKWLGGD